MLKCKSEASNTEHMIIIFSTKDKNALYDASVFYFSKVIVYFFNCKDLRNVVEYTKNRDRNTNIVLWEEK